MIVAGAKGFASELIDVVLEHVGSEELMFFDSLSSDISDKKFGRYPILRSEAEVSRYFAEGDNRFVIGAGPPKSRKALYELFINLGGIPYVLISVRAHVGQHENTIGEASCLMPGVIVEAGNTIGKGVLIHVGSFISHDVSIGDFCEISPYAKLLGATSVGSNTSVGTGAIILPGVKVGNNAVVGAGAVVTKDVQDYTTVVGVPAVIINR